MNTLEIKGQNKVFTNLTVGELYEHAVRNGEANIVSTGALAVNTGYHTARAAKDKFIVKEPLPKGIYLGMKIISR